MKAWGLFLLIIIFSSCSSNKYKDEEHENLKKDYEVRNSSSKYRPGWIENAEAWADENDLDLNEYDKISLYTRSKKSYITDTDIKNNENNWYWC